MMLFVQQRFIIVIVWSFNYITGDNFNGSIIIPVTDLNVFNVHTRSQINSFNVYVKVRN